MPQEAEPIAPFVEVVGMAKAYGGAQMLKGVSLTLLPGEMHGLTGLSAPEN